MSAVLVVLVFALVALAAKRYAAGQVWLPQLLRSHSKKEEEDEAKVELVIDKSATSPTSSGKQNINNSSQTARKSSLSKPPRYEGPRSPVRSVEVSIRTALNDLRSRQVVKNLCSKFEARVARHALVRPEGDDDDEEACIRAANPDGGDEYLQPARAQQLRREDAHAAIKPAPFMGRRNSNAAAKPNNLNAFLRRYSSNLDRANFGESSGATCSSDPVLPEVTSVNAIEVVAEAAAPAPVPAPVQHLAEIDLLDLQPGSDEASNQCDSPARSTESRRRDVHGDDGNDEEPAGDCGFHHGDWDVTAAKEQQQAPEECPAEPKSALPVVHNSVVRFQQFQQQIPSNHARTAPLSIAQ